jgi:hypothetical protein
MRVTLERGALQALCRDSGTPLFFGDLAHQVIQTAISEAGGVENLDSIVQYYKKVMKR